MSSTYTSRIKLELQADGENANTWGQRLNNNVIQLVDDAVAAYTTISLAGGVSYTLTNNDGASDEARSAILEFKGEITTSINVIIPSQSKFYLIRDKTTRISNSSYVLQTAGNAGVSPPVSSRGIFFCDGVNIHQFNASGLGLGTAADFNATNTSITATADVDSSGGINATTIVSLDNVTLSIIAGYTMHGTSVKANTHVVSRETATAITVNLAQTIADDTNLTFKNPVSAQDIPNVSVADARYVRVSAADTIRGAKTYTSINTFGGQVVGTPKTVTYTTSLTLDLNEACNFICSLSASDVSIGNPSNAVPGQSGTIYLIQNVSGSHAATYGSAWKFVGASVPNLSTAVSAVDLLVYNVRSATTIDSIILQNFGRP
jgi:hypothetical protein|tara:strand:- start:650 stop:1777 length:1128 start_codon:yes stop_codon:yes gene_type:complete